MGEAFRNKGSNFDPDADFERMSLDEYLKHAAESERRKDEVKLCRDNMRILRIFRDMLMIDGFMTRTSMTSAGTTDIISPKYKESI